MMNCVFEAAIKIYCSKLLNSGSKHFGNGILEIDKELSENKLAAFFERTSKNFQNCWKFAEKLYHGFPEIIFIRG